MFQDIKKIYDCLQDDISRQVFMARLDYAATQDLHYITQIPAECRSLSADVEWFCERYKNINGRTVIFGAGANGRRLVRGFRMTPVTVFLDNYRYGKKDEITGIPVYKPEEYIQSCGIADTTFVISVNDRDAAGRMIQQLKDCRVREQNILVAPADWRNNNSQYFDLFTPEDGEVFVDCGCYDGGTTFRFAGWCGAKGYDGIYCFEADTQSYDICKKQLNGLHNCVVYPYGVSDRNQRVSFLGNGRENARIAGVDERTTDAMTEIETVSLDNLLGGRRVTFIKMDIEGAEVDALRGARELIQTYKPRLAISVYHRLEHLTEIPELLLSIRPDYKLWLRQYSLFEDETIMYAK